MSEVIELTNHEIDDIEPNTLTDSAKDGKSSCHKELFARKFHQFLESKSTRIQNLIQNHFHLEELLINFFSLYRNNDGTVPKVESLNRYKSIVREIIMKESNDKIDINDTEDFVRLNQSFNTYIASLKSEFNQDVIKIADIPNYNMQIIYDFFVLFTNCDGRHLTPVPNPWWTPK